MDRHEQVARADAITSLSVALAVMKKFERQHYARLSLRRRSTENLDRMERVTIEEMADVLAKRFAGFAAFDGAEVHHWQIVRPIVHQALTAVPLEIRAKLATAGASSSREVAMRIFAAVDQRFRLVPLKGHPGPSGHGSWEPIFEDEFGRRAE